MKCHSSPGQGRAHVQSVEEPDKAENAHPDGYVDEELANISLRFFLFFVLSDQNWWFVLFLSVRLSIRGHIPLPGPPHI